MNQAQNDKTRNDKTRNEKTEPKSDKPKRDWVEIGLKAFTPIVAGLLIAWAGFVSNYTLSSISNNQQSARLITELQIRREQAESDLRKDVFDQTLQAFLLKNQQPDNSIAGMSKQLLRLELLALNFGDSLSLSPLFAEFREDLKNIKPKKNEIPNFQEARGELRKRLYSLARRVASAQVSSLHQHGVTKKINVPLVTYNEKGVTPCTSLLYEDSFPWPERDLQRNFGIFDDKNKLLMQDSELSSLFNSADIKNEYRQLLNESRRTDLQGVTRYLEVRVSDVDHCNKSAKLTVILYKKRVEDTTTPHIETVTDVSGRGDLALIGNEGLEIEVKRSFNLDYFNFPKVNNTRLGNNHRFAIVLDEFDLKSDQPHIELIALVFPSEYASLRDRPGMEEARKLLQEALKEKEQD